jgi:hypothetical protein
VRPVEAIDRKDHAIVVGLLAVGSQGIDQPIDDHHAIGARRAFGAVHDNRSAEQTLDAELFALHVVRDGEIEVRAGLREHDAQLAGPAGHHRERVDAPHQRRGENEPQRVRNVDVADPQTELGSGARADQRTWNHRRLAALTKRFGQSSGKRVAVRMPHHAARFELEREHAVARDAGRRAIVVGLCGRQGSRCRPSGEEEQKKDGGPSTSSPASPAISTSISPATSASRPRTSSASRASTSGPAASGC